MSSQSVSEGAAQLLGTLSHFVSLISLYHLDLCSSSSMAVGNEFSRTTPTALAGGGARLHDYLSYATRRSCYSSPNIIQFMLFYFLFGGAENLLQSLNQNGVC